MKGIVRVEFIVNRDVPLRAINCIEVAAAIEQVRAELHALGFEVSESSVTASLFNTDGCEVGVDGRGVLVLSRGPTLRKEASEVVLGDTKPGNKNDVDCPTCLHPETVELGAPRAVYGRHCMRCRWFGD